MYKTVMRYNTRTAKIEYSEKTKCGWRCRETESLIWGWRKWEIVQLALCPALDADPSRPGFWLALVHGELYAEPLQEVRRNEESEVSVPWPPPSVVTLRWTWLCPKITCFLLKGTIFLGFDNHSFVFYFRSRWADQPSWFVGTEVFLGHGILSLKTGTVLGKQGWAGFPS